MTAQTIPSTSQPRNVPSWRFWLPLLAQAALILSIPAQAIYTQLTGETVVLQTGPVDPYSLLQGYYVTLSYEISRVETLEKLPGGERLKAAQDALQGSVRPSVFETGTPFYVILEAPADQTSQPPLPWTPIRISGDRPTDLPDNQIALRGNYNDGFITYGLESYYIPEDERIEINDRIQQAQQPNEPPSFVVTVKVNAQGQATLVDLWVGDRNYRY